MWLKKSNFNFFFKTLIRNIYGGDTPYDIQKVQITFYYEKVHTYILPPNLQTQFLLSKSADTHLLPLHLQTHVIHKKVQKHSFIFTKNVCPFGDQKLVQLLE